MVGVTCTCSSGEVPAESYTRRGRLDRPARQTSLTTVALTRDEFLTNAGCEYFSNLRTALMRCHTDDDASITQPFCSRVKNAPTNECLEWYGSCEVGGFTHERAQRETTLRTARRVCRELVGSRPTSRSVQFHPEDETLERAPRSCTANTIESRQHSPASVEERWVRLRSGGSD